MVLWSAIVSLVTFVAGIAILVYLNRGQREAACDLIRAAVHTYETDRKAQPGTPAASRDAALAEAWRKFGMTQGCVGMEGP